MEDSESKRVLNIIGSDNLQVFVSWLNEKEENKNFMIRREEDYEEPILMNLVTKNYTEMIKILLDRNCDLNQTDSSSDQTAFVVACQDVNFEVMIMLSNEGCSIDFGHAEDDDHPLVYAWEDTDMNELEKNVKVFLFCAEIGMKLPNFEKYEDGFPVWYPTKLHHTYDHDWEFFSEFQKQKKERIKIIEAKEQILKQICIQITFTERTEQIILQYIGFEIDIQNINRDELWHFSNYCSDYIDF